MMKDLNDVVRAATVTKVQPSENVQEDNSDDVSGDNDNQPLLKADASQIEQQSAPEGRATAVHDPLRSWKRIRALGYIGFAAFNFSIMSVCVKYASRHVTSHETVFWRTSIAWLLNFIMLKLKHVDLTVEPKYHKILAFRCFIGMVGISLQFYAMQRMVLTDAVVLIFTSPVLTFLLGALVLGEAVERIDFLSGVFAYCGVIFVARPAFLFPTHVTAKDATALAVLCAMGGAFTQACAYICMRKLHDVNYMVIIHYFLLFGICFSLLTLSFFNVSLKLHLAGEVMLALFGSGLFAFVGQIFLTKGFQQEKAGIASVMRYFDVLFVLLWDTTILGEIVSGYSLFGGAIILIGAAMIVVRRANTHK